MTYIQILSRQQELRRIQLTGLCWMGNLHAAGFHGILADEMGLGKTLQTIAFLSHLHSEDDALTALKSLVIVPLSLMMNWKSEWETFAPDMKVSFLQGDSNERQALKETLKTFPNKTQILMTTYEMANREIDFIADHEWNFLVIDEGHRLKNPDSLLHRNLSTLQCKGRLLLTGANAFVLWRTTYQLNYLGTPVQNNLLELHALLKFCNPIGLFPDSGSDFASWYKDADSQLRLSDLISPYVLYP